MRGWAQTLLARSLHVSARLDIGLLAYWWPGHHSRYAVFLAAVALIAFGPLPERIVKSRDSRSELMVV